MSEIRREPPSAIARASALVTPAIRREVTRLAPTLTDAVTHHLDGGGKGVRGALSVLSAEAVGAHSEVGVLGGVAVELVHNYSLIHDDICDGDKERRHRPTTWVIYGVGPAIIAGDALAALATEILLDEPTPERVAAARRLGTANQAMIAGQAADMAFESRISVTVEECIEMEAGKTGALLGCASSIGAVLAGAPSNTVEALCAFGENLGIAFQAVDDLLGIWGRTEFTGKAVGADLYAKKKALPMAAAMARGDDGAKELESIFAKDLSEKDVARATHLIEAAGARTLVTEIADSHLKAALEAISSVDLAPQAVEDLSAIAFYVTQRDH